MIDERPTPTLRLLTTSGRALILRFVSCNDRFGPDRQKVHTGMRPIVDVSVETARGTAHVTAVDAQGLIDSIVPGKEASLATGGTAEIDADEARRLLDWIEDPHAAASGVPRLLLAADHDVQREVMRALGAMRVEVTRVDDGARALKLARNLTPELVLVHSAVHSSLEVLRRLREGAAEEDTKLVLLAAGSASSPHADITLSWPEEAAELAEIAHDALELV